MRWDCPRCGRRNQRCRSRGYQRSGLCRVGGKPVLENQLKLASPVRETITLRSFLGFYIPLAMTSLLTLLVTDRQRCTVAYASSPTRWPSGRL